VTPRDDADLLPPLAEIPPETRGPLTTVALTLMLIASFGLKLHHLGHLALKGLDESFHAVVAANLLEHPLAPMLIDRPLLPYDYRNWSSNHVWLHKGIVPLWQIALSFKVWGVETFGLRFPSALLTTLSALLTYLIGRELLDRGAALTAAFLHAFSPQMLMLAHGYAFSDHIDVALVFWAELGIWLVVRAMRTGRLSYAALAGAAQALAFLSKMYPALIVTGVALVAWLAPAMRLARREDTRLAGKHLLALLGVSIAVAAPWLIWTAVKFPDEFRHEYLYALWHFGADVEGFAAPWDRVVFGYALASLDLFYPLALASTVFLLVRAAQMRDIRQWIILAWALGVFVTFTVARSKTPSATAPGWPALYLIVGATVARAARGDGLMLGTCLVATVLMVVARGGFDVLAKGGASGEILRRNIWVLWHALAALGGGAALQLVAPRLGRNVMGALFLGAGLGVLALGLSWAGRAWAVVQMNDNEPAFVEIGGYARQRLPREAVLLLDEREKLERNTLMFRARRTTYGVTEQNWRDVALEVVKNGGIPFVVSHRQLPLPRILASPRDGRILYQVPSTRPAVE
jgi:4-amino-4-deoxy-L-arabinose transferase